MDVWLFANADLTVASGSGPDVIPFALNHHVLYACYIHPFTALLCSPNTSVLFVHVRREGQRVPLMEFLSSKVYRDDDYAQRGFIVEYSSCDEILEAVKEKLDIMAGKKLSSDDMRLQTLFRTQSMKHGLQYKYPQPSNVFPYEVDQLWHGPIKGLASSVYLRQYRDELEMDKAEWE